MVSACGYSHGELGGDEVTDDGDVDAPSSDGVVVDAAPDATEIQKSWVAVEMLTVPVNGTTVTSTTVLAIGGTYRLRASGTFVIQSPAGTPGDAEWWDYNNVIQDGVVGVDVGLAVNDLTNDETRTPKWGAYRTDHIYEIDFPATGATIVAMLHDGNHANNTGSLTLTILSWQ